MALDPSILLQSQPVQIQSPLDAMSKVMTLKNMARQGQAQDRELADQQALRDAYKGNMTVGSDGTPTLNRQGFMSQLGQQNPMLAMQKGQELQAQDVSMKEKNLGLLKQQTEGAHQLTMSIAPDGSNWDQVRQQALALGLPGAQNSPQQFPGPDVVRHMQAATMEMKDQVAAADRQRSFQEKQTEFGLKRQDLALKREQLVSDKDNKDAKELDKHLSSGWAGRSGQAGAVQAKIIAAEAAEKLIEQGKSQPGGLDSRQTEELAQSAGRLLGGTAAASARIEALVPHTFWGGVQSKAEWLANSPRGQDMQAFTDRIAETVAREKELAQNQMKQFQVEGLPAHAALQRRNPTLYNTILQAKGIDPTVIDEKGRYKAPAKVDDLHSMSDADIDKLYQQSGGK